jgi:hypothetical protein
MDFIFNELSFRNIASDLHSGKSGMANLLQVCKKGRELGMMRLAIRHDFFEQHLYNGYRISDWLNDQTVSKVFKDLLLSIIRQPYIDNNDIKIEERFITSYAFLLDEDRLETEGLAIAYLYQTIAVSFHFSNDWDVYVIDLKFSEAGYDDQIVKVNHASQVKHLELHKDWIASRVGKKLPVTNLSFNEKQINLRDDHGKDILLKFSRKLVRSQYVIKVINSLPFNPQETDFIRNYYDDGKIEIVLIRSDHGLGVVIQTTGENLFETKAIGEILNEEFRDKY